MRFVIYMIGFFILIGGLAWAAITAGAPQLYVVIRGVFSWAAVSLDVAPGAAL